MSDFDVVPGGMDDVAAQLGRLPGDVQAALQILAGKVNQFADLNDGASVQAYANAQAQWNQGLSMVNDGVAKAAPILSQMSAEYTEGDLRAAQPFG
ncbi:WXG100 family type VII secretion target [Micromonospora lupini]|uniref:WXG100 family type VII secretion target n=1 Tax=Micromonospora lupini TaxID=285679 RepID=UPI0033F141C4